MKKSIGKLISVFLVLCMLTGSITIASASAEDKSLLRFDFNTNLNGWSNTNSCSRSTDPTDETNGVFCCRPTGSNAWLNPRAFFDDTENEDKLFTGRVMITEAGKLAYDYKLRGGANESLVLFEQNGNIKVRGTSVNLKWKVNEWISFSVFIEYSASDKTACPVYVNLCSDEGIVDNNNEIVNTFTYKEATIDMTRYASNFGATGTARNSINSWCYMANDAEGIVCVDDVSVMVPAQPTVSRINPPTEPESDVSFIDLQFSHWMDTSTLIEDNFSLTSQGGISYPISSVDINRKQPDKVRINLASEIVESGIYTLSMNNCKDISGASVANNITLDIEGSVFTPITALAIETDDSLSPTYGDTSAINFSAITTPLDGVSVKTVEWYVNDEKQPTTGISFAYTPTEAEAYSVYAKVANTDIVSNTMQINVAKANPVVVWPTTSIIYQGSAFGDALNSDGEGDGVFTIEDAEVVPAVNQEGYTKTITFTPNDTKNYNIITHDTIIIVNDTTDIAYDAVTVTSADAMCTKLSEVQPVSFSVTTVPSNGPDANTINWYVNGKKQAATGKNFTYTPTAAGSYKISVSVANNPAANVTSKNIIVLPDEAITSGTISYINDDFSSGSLSKWSNISGKEPGSGVRISADPLDSGNNVADYYAASTGSTFIGMRKVMDASNPLVMSGRVMLYGQPEDSGNYADRSFSILLRSMIDGYGSNTLLAFNFNKTIVLGGQNVASWDNSNDWIDFTVCLIPNGNNPAECKIYGLFNNVVKPDGQKGSLVTSVIANYSNFAFDNPQVQFNSSIRANKDGRNHVYLDDFSGYSITQFEPSLYQTVNVPTGNSLLMLFNHETDASSITTDNISVYDETADTPLTISSIVADETNSVYCALNFENMLEENHIYRIDFDRDLKDMADMSSCYSSIYFSTGSQTPPEPVAAQIPVNRIAIYPESFELPIGFALPCQLAVAVSPDTASNPTLRWESSDTEVAIIDENGNIVGIKEGTVTITAYATDGSGVVSNECLLTVTEGRSSDENQKISLGSGSGRIDTEAHLAWPTEIGSGQVALWDDNKTGAITITVDDCITGDFEQWKAWTRDYGFKFTFFVPTKEYGTPSWQATALEGLLEAGEDVQSHSYHHYDDNRIAGLSSAESILEFKQPFAAINSLNGGSCKALAYSYGTGDQDYASQFYIASRGVVTLKLNQADSINYKYISSISMDGSQNITEDNNGTPSLESAIKSLYDKNYRYRGTSYYGGWTCFHTHGLGSLSSGTIIPDETKISTADEYKYLFDNYMYPAKDKLWVGRFSDVAAYAQERDTANLTMLSSDSAHISYNLTDEMNDDLFDYPLTVKIKVDSSWSDITATQNGAPLEVTEVTSGSDKYVMVKSVPDRGVVTLSHSADDDISIFSGIKCVASDNTLTLTSDSDTELKLYTAIYSGDKLEAIETKVCRLTANTDYSVTLSVPDISAGQTVKLLLWNNDMNPIILPLLP